MIGRILVLLRARLASQRGGSALPVAPLLMLVFVSGVFCALIPGETQPFAYALAALSVCAALVAVPLLGDLSALLTADETGEWVRALPVRDFEIHVARALHLLLVLTVLATGVLAPALVFAPDTFSLTQRAGLWLAGWSLSVSLAATLLTLQAVLRGRGHALLVALQSVWLVGALFGAVLGLQFVTRITGWTGPSAAPTLAYYPPAWFAAQFSNDALSSAWQFGAFACTALALALVLGVPAPPPAAANSSSTLVGALLAPLRHALARVWVRGRERATYELVFDALPKEREFVVRAYPLLAVPLGFLVLGAQSPTGSSRESLLALLLFIPGAYAPLLAAHTPGSNSHRARWLLDTAPVEPGELHNGVLKAVVARFLAPLYAVLIVLGCLQGQWQLTLQLAPPAFLCAVLVLRSVWRVCVIDSPLSVPHDQLYINNDWLGGLAVVAIALLLASLGATRYLDSWSASALATAALLAYERVLDRSMSAGELRPAQRQAGK